MTRQEQVVVIRGAISSTDALCLVSSLTGDIDARLAPEIIYPYYCFDAACSVPRLLPVELCRDSAAAIAQRTVTHRMGKKLRMIASFDISIVPRGMVHKRFWIVQSIEAKVMVDSTTGSLHPLKLKAA